MTLDELLSKKEIEEKLQEIKTADELYELVKEDINKEDFLVQLQKMYDDAEESQLSEEHLNSITAAGATGPAGAWTPDQGFGATGPAGGWLLEEADGVCTLRAQNGMCIHRRN